MTLGKHGNKIDLDSGTHLFLYQLVGTWGQLLFPKPWKEFRLWYDEHKTKGIKPFLDGMVIFMLKYPLLEYFNFCLLLKNQIIFAGDNRMVQEDGRKNLDSLVHKIYSFSWLF